jgi:S-(hydroxymethyl)glutathione dehydrogenase/alcohol dehydrogenase
VINGGEGDPVAKVRELTGGKGADYAFDAIGLGKVLEQCFAMTKVGGMAIEVGVSRGLRVLRGLFLLDPD